MIIEENIQDHPGLVRRYSSHGYLIQNDQTGAKYEEAVDIIGLYTYTETNEYPESEEEITDHEALNIVLGRSDEDEQGGSDEDT